MAENSPEVPKCETSEQSDQPVAAAVTVPKIRYDWYQTETHVVITILAKNVIAEQTKVEIESTKLNVCARLPTGNDYTLELNLSFPINPSQSSYKIVPSKIEVKLKKVDDIRWYKLEVDPNAPTMPVAASIPAGLISSGPPSYPSSSKKAKDWNKVEIEDDKPEGEAALNALFQQIYNDSTDEVKKAMNKSFSESGGTVLSTNWNEVGATKVDVKPPEGQEFKKWN